MKSGKSSCLDALGVVYAGRNPHDGVQVDGVEQLPVDCLPGAALEPRVVRHHYSGAACGREHGAHVLHEVALQLVFVLRQVALVKHVAAQLADISDGLQIGNGHRGVHRHPAACDTSHQEVESRHNNQGRGWPTERLLKPIPVFCHARLAVG